MIGTKWATFRSTVSASRFGTMMRGQAAGLADREQVRVAVEADAKLTLNYFVMNAAATFIAGYGLLANSEAVIIGAMLIAMLYGPIVAIGLSLARLDPALLLRAATAEAVGVVWVLSIGLIIGLIHWKIPISDQILSRTSPNILDLMIALTGGAAGAYAASAPRVSSAVVGVAIATALCPPLTACGILLARGYPTLAGGAALLFFTNLAAIATAAMAVFLVVGHRAIRTSGSPLSTWVARAIPLIVLVALGGYLVDALRRNVEEASLKNAVLGAVETAIVTTPGARVIEVRLEKAFDDATAFAVIRTPVPFTTEMVARLNDEVERAVGRKLSLHVRSVLVSEVTREGVAFTDRPLEKRLTVR